MPNKSKKNIHQLLFYLTAFGLLIASIILTLLNKNNDFLANSSLNLAEIFDSISVFYRGPLFYYILKILSEFSNIKTSVFILSVLIPIIHFTFFFRLLSDKNLLFIIIYISIVYFGQLNHLLKMAISQTLLMYALIGFNRFRFTIILLSIGMHLQAAVGCFIYAKYFNKWAVILSATLVLLLVFFYRDYINLNLESFEFYSAYMIYDFDLFKGGYEIHSINLILFLLYVFARFISRKAPKDEISRSIENIIDGSLFLIIVFFKNPVVSGRIFDYCWVFILIYLSRIQSIFKLNNYFLIIFSLYSLVWGLNFLKKTILLI